MIQQSHSECDGWSPRSRHESREDCKSVHPDVTQAILSDTTSIQDIPKQPPHENILVPVTVDSLPVKVLRQTTSGVTLATRVRDGRSSVCQRPRFSVCQRPRLWNTEAARRTGRIVLDFCRMVSLVAALMLACFAWRLTYNSTRPPDIRFKHYIVAVTSTLSTICFLVGGTLYELHNPRDVESDSAACRSRAGPRYRDYFFLGLAFGFLLGSISFICTVSLGNDKSSSESTVALGAVGIVSAIGACILMSSMLYLRLLCLKPVRHMAY